VDLRLAALTAITYCSLVSAYDEAARDRLKTLIDDLASQKGLQLGEVADRAGISEATLRRARHRFDTPITTGTLRGLERAYGLAHRELDKVLTTPDYRPQPKTKPLAPRTATSGEVIRFLRKFVAAQPDEAHKLRAQIMTIWDERQGAPGE
jgi:DNA-binding Xre family transcriptional regulator